MPSEVATYQLQQQQHLQQQQQQQRAGGGRSQRRCASSSCAAVTNHRHPSYRHRLTSAERVPPSLARLARLSRVARVLDIDSIATNGAASLDIIAGRP